MLFYKICCAHFYSYIQYVQYVVPVLLIIKGIWHKIIAFLLFADMTPCLLSNLTFTHFHPFTAWLLTSLPNTLLPQTRSSIIRPELIVMHFTAEVGKPYPWISTMYPPAYPHTYVPSPLLPTPDLSASLSLLSPGEPGSYYSSTPPTTPVSYTRIHIDNWPISSEMSQ